jgi:hypothetical protein
LGTFVLLPLLLAFLAACGGPGDDASPEADSAGEALPAATQEEPLTLGPVDGFGLAPTDLDRVAVGMMAPDFTLEGLSGEVVSLSAFRGAKNVILVFYRGHW